MSLGSLSLPVILMEKNRYKVRARERGEWQKQRDDLLAEQKELESEMAAFVTKHENEINEFLHAYWTMRRQAGKFDYSCFPATAS